MTTPQAAAALRFGRFELQINERRLLVGGEPATLGARAFDLLLALAERPGRLVGKRALLELVWPGLVVQDNNLAAQMSALRKVIGDDVITTIPGRGYRFVARPEPAAPGGAAATAATAGAAEPASTARAAPPTHLPAALIALLGRSDDLTSLGALIDGHRVVTLVGPGGIGKSLLAQHLLHAHRNAYPHGVCWVELAPVHDAAALPGAIATALGVQGGPGDPMAQLIGALAPLTMLLALDNAEHQLADVAQLCHTLHGACPALRLLVTSQAPLRIAAERVMRIEPLAVPATPLPVALARVFGAVALFVERVQAIDARFELSDANAPAVIELCRTLDGLPLAIELAAARAPLLGVPQLLASIHQRLQLLTANRNRGAPERQRTLRAALAWSHGLLQVREQQVFRRLGVMAGSASLAFIEQVVADEGGDLDSWAVLDALDVLIDRSLVAVWDAPAGEPSTSEAPRYRLLESPRAYALERLDEARERPALQRRHALAMASLCDRAYDDYFGGAIGADDWLRRLAPDLDNARDALAWARAAGDGSTELTIAATLLRALPPSLHADRMALADACEARLATVVVPAPLQQRVHIELSCAWADTQKLRARDAAACALGLARQLDHEHGDPFMVYHALARSASALAQAGDVVAAQPLLHELQSLEDSAWPAQRLLWGAEAAQVMARLCGDAHDTLQRSRRLVALDRARGSGASIALGNLIDHELAAGDAAAAARSGAALVAWLQGTRDEYSLAFARINLCAALLALGDVAQALTVAQAMWPQAMRFELQHAAAAYLALLAALQQRPRAAARLAGYAQATYDARAEAVEANEAVAMGRARALAVAALGETAFARAQSDGATLGDADIAPVAFGDDDPASGSHPSSA
ncbi:MAG TPA: winged helix-turn-helix domain-containing protein [Burkholderiaceae bacterium]|nr:winged helix-turn-helix domain-containing protein [Burkholderiaceae bacterium]